MVGCEDFLYNLDQFLKKLESNLLPLMAEQFNEIHNLKIENEDFKSRISLENKG